MLLAATLRHLFDHTCFGHVLLVDDVMADGLARQESFHAFAQWKSRSYLERTSEVVVRDWCAYVARLAVLVSPSLVALGTISRS